MASSAALAEYRVYQYYVKSKNDIPTDKQSYLVLSTLDPVAYVSYHGGSLSIKGSCFN